MLLSIMRGLLLWLALTAASASDMTYLKPGAFLCVSLGMPDRVLQQYLRQASTYPIPVVIRGLWQDNFRATSQRTYTLLQPAEEPPIPGGIAIDPHPFRLAHLKTVPALVVFDGSHYDVVYGNVPLETLLHTVATSGSTDSLRNLAMKLEKHA